MSDDEWNDDNGGDDGWGNEFEEEEEPQDQQEDSIKIQIENLFYEAEDAKRSNPARALKQFEECVELTKNAGPEFIAKRFKSLEHIVTLYLQTHNMDKMKMRYNELLSYAADVTRNEYSESINKILNAVGELSSADSSAAVEEMYSVTLKQLKTMGNQERMWFNTNMKLCKIYMNQQRFDRASELLREMHQSCCNPNGTDDKSKGSQLLEIYAMEFQLHSERRDNAKLKELFSKTKDLSAEINDPRSMSVIRECWGKMYANEDQWKDAFAEFFQAFKQYQEIGHSRAKQCLKYVVISGLLSQNQVNPFDAQEAKVFEKTPDIQALVNIRLAYDRGDVKQVEEILRKNASTITDDAFIRQHLDSLLTQVRSKTLLDIVKPYSSIRIASLAQKLMISDSEVQSLLVRLLLDEKIQGKIDQVQSVLILSSSRNVSSSKYQALNHWCESIENIERSLCSKLVV